MRVSKRIDQICHGLMIHETINHKDIFMNMMSTHTSLHDFTSRQTLRACMYIFHY